MKRIISLLVCIILTLSLFTGCNSSPDPTTESTGGTPEGTSTEDTASDDEGYTIGCVIISGTIQHCQLFKQGFEETCEENGAEAIVLDADYDPQTLMTAISDLISKDVDGIVVEACDAQAPLQGIKEAADAGIVVAGSDMLLDFTEDDGYLISQNSSDNYSGGYACGEDVVKRANGEEFNVCIMELQTNSSAVLRVDGFQDAIADHDNIHILKIDTPNPENLEQKMAVCDAWVEKFDDIDAIFCYHDPAAIACVSSLKAAGRLEGTLIYGVDGNEENLIAIKNGEITGSAKQNPYRLAQLATEDVFTVLNGGKIDHDYITYVPIDFVTEDNVDKFLE